MPNDKSDEQNSFNQKKDNSHNVHAARLSKNAQSIIKKKSEEKSTKQEEIDIFTGKTR